MGKPLYAIVRIGIQTGNGEISRRPAGSGAYRVEEWGEDMKHWYLLGNHQWDRPKEPITAAGSGYLYEYVKGVDCFKLHEKQLLVSHRISQGWQ